jgi:hypothetical protein
MAILAAAGGLLGFVTGSDYGDLFAPEWALASLRGYQATRLVGLLSGAAAAIIASGGALIAQRHRSILPPGSGAVVGILLTEPLLFPLLPPHHALLPVAYLGSAAAGAALFALIGRGVGHRRGADRR